MRHFSSEPERSVEVDGVGESLKVELGRATRLPLSTRRTVSVVALVTI